VLGIHFNIWISTKIGVDWTFMPYLFLFFVCIWFTFFDVIYLLRFWGLIYFIVWLILILKNMVRLSAFYLLILIILNYLYGFCYLLFFLNFIRITLSTLSYWLISKPFKISCSLILKLLITSIIKLRNRHRFFLLHFLKLIQIFFLFHIQH